MVRRCLESSEPSERAPLLILQGFALQGDMAAAHLGKKLRSTKWIPLALGGAIAPDSILNIEGIEAELHRLLDPNRDGVASVLAVAEWVQTMMASRPCERTYHGSRTHWNCLRCGSRKGQTGISA